MVGLVISRQWFAILSGSLGKYKDGDRMNFQTKSPIYNNALLFDTTRVKRDNNYPRISCLVNRKSALASCEETIWPFN
jgi:hypothetical protein